MLTSDNAHPGCRRSKRAEETPKCWPSTTVPLPGSLTHRAGGAVPFLCAESSRPRSRPRPPHKRARRSHKIEASQNRENTEPHGARRLLIGLYALQPDSPLALPAHNGSGIEGRHPRPSCAAATGYRRNRTMRGLRRFIRTALASSTHPPRPRLACVSTRACISTQEPVTAWT